MKPGAEFAVVRYQRLPGNRRARPWVIPLALLASLATAPLMASPPTDQDPDLEPFERMGQALGSLSYEGILVYSHENRMETLRIQQRVVDGRVQASLESLNGQPRHIQQDGPQVVCRLSGEHLIAVAQRALGQQTPAGRPLKARDLAPHYLVQSQGQTRVAGRPTQVMAILPGDDLRYGYRFYLDTATGLPLKMDLLDADTGIIEQIMFTSLTLDPANPRSTHTVPLSPLAPSMIGGSPQPTPEVASPPAMPSVPPGEVIAPALPSAPLEAGDRPGMPSAAQGGISPLALPSGAPEAASLPATTAWTFQGLPPGFLLAVTERIPDAAGNPMEHFIISDGLATISVYVESAAQEGLNGASRIGAIHAQGGRIAGHQVTVVGEAPARTIAAVLSALRHQPETGG